MSDRDEAAQVEPEHGRRGDLASWQVGLQWAAAPTREHVKELHGRRGLTLYDRMRRSDYQVAAVLRAVTLPIRQGTWSVDPAGKSDEERTIAERCERAMFHDMSTTWDDAVRWALLMLPFGFSVLEQVLEVKDDGLVFPRKLDIRHPLSFDGDRRDADGTLTHLVQDIDGERRELPVRQLLIFSTDREGDDWRGTSILRPAYKPWLIKDDLERLNAVMHARWSAGIPTMKVPSTVEVNSPEWREAEKSLKALRSHERAFMIYQDGWEPGTLAKSSGTTQPLESIRHYDAAIAAAMLAMHISLGGARTASRALGATFVDAFLHAIQAWADYVGEVLTRFGLRDWVRRNWGERERYPIVRVRNIHRIALQTLGYLVQTGVIPPGDEDIADYAKRAADIPMPVDDRDEGDGGDVVDPEDGTGDDGGEPTTALVTPEAERRAAVERRRYNEARAVADRALLRAYRAGAFNR